MGRTDTSNGETGYGGLAGSQALRRLFGHVTLYGMGNLLQRASGILLLPAYVSQLSPEEFGALALISLLPFILPAVLSLGLPHAIMRYYHEWNRAGDAAAGLTAVWIVCVGSLLGGTFLLDQFGRSLVQPVISSVPFDPDLRLGLWWAFWSGAGLCPLFLLRVLERSRLLLVVSLATAAFTVGFTLVAIYGGWGVRGIVGVQLVGSALVACGTTIWLVSNMAWPPRWGRLSQALRFGLPLVPSAVLEAAANRADRFFLDKWALLHDIGLYSMANQIGQAVKLFYDAVKPAWFPFYIRVAGERADARRLLGGAAVLYVAALTVTALAVLLLAVPILTWFGFESRYAEATPLIPIFVLGYYLFGFAPLGTAAVQVGEKTMWQPFLQFIHVTIVIAANMVLTRLYGAWGAAWALTICYGALAALYVWAGHQAYAISMQWVRMAGIVAAGTFVALGGLWWPQERVIEKSIVLVLFALLCLQLLRIDDGPLSEVFSRRGHARLPKA